MADLLDGVVRDRDRRDTATDATEAAVSLAELHNRLNRAYLSGDGAAVERVMALIAATR